MHNLKVNDKLEFTDSDNKKYDFIISSITQNYLNDYIYMNKETYNKKYYSANGKKYIHLILKQG